MVVCALFVCLGLRQVQGFMSGLQAKRPRPNVAEAAQDEHIVEKTVAVVSPDNFDLNSYISDYVGPTRVRLSEFHRSMYTGFFVLTVICRGVICTGTGYAFALYCQGVPGSPKESLRNGYSRPAKVCHRCSCGKEEEASCQMGFIDFVVILVILYVFLLLSVALWWLLCLVLRRGRMSTRYLEVVERAQVSCPELRSFVPDVEWAADMKVPFVFFFRGWHFKTLSYILHFLTCIFVRLLSIRTEKE